ncbi:MAG: hypothetical protein QM718_09970 [Steroidobacteraceae bacterium]
MKVLLDECVDARFAPHVTGFDTQAVLGKGWSGISNGKLLALAQAEFDVFVTVDKNLSFQQHLPKFSIAVILIHYKSNRVQDLLSLLPELIDAIPKTLKGQVSHVGA